MDRLLTYSSWAEVDLGAIRHNFREIKRLFPFVRMIAVIKADAYGHGMTEIARLLENEKANIFGVSGIHEGILLRKKRIKQSILVFENILSCYADDIIRYRLIPTVCTLDFAQALNRSARKRKRIVDIHIKVDTGMGRLGIWYPQAIDFVEQIHRLNFLRIEGIYTHFPAADSNRVFTKRQLRMLKQLIRNLDQRGYVIPYVHAANSMGLMGYKTDLNVARPGIMLYGLNPKPQSKLRISLKPALTVKSRIIFLKEVLKGRSISYGRTFIAKKKMMIATVPIGYYDGYFRYLSNKAFCLIGGKRCRLVGRVTMDQIMVDVTCVKNISLGMEVILLGKQGREVISADELAQKAGTINYEIVCSLGNRLPRVYKV